MPFVAGQEVCGTVDAVGADGSSGLVHTRVMAVTNFYLGHGGFAEYTLANTPGVFHVPDDMSDADAASFRIGFSTAWIGLVRRGHLQPGEHLVVLGAAGGSGATAVQLGKALAAHVTTVAAGTEKLEFSPRMGADATVDRTASEQRRHRRRDPRGDQAGTSGPDLRPGGRRPGQPVGTHDGTRRSPARRRVREWQLGRRLRLRPAARGTWSLVGVYAGSYTREENEADHEALLALAGDGKLESFATVVPFEALPDVLTVVGDGTVIGKMVVQVA